MVPGGAERRCRWVLAKPVGGACGQPDLGAGLADAAGLGQRLDEFALALGGPAVAARAQRRGSEGEDGGSELGAAPPRSDGSSASRGGGGEQGCSLRGLGRRGRKHADRRQIGIAPAQQAVDPLVHFLGS
jgi:hypothetical protein